MKQKIILLAFVVIMANAQTLKVKQIEEVKELSEKRQYYAQYSPDGTKILSTTENYEGINIYNIESKQVTKVTEAIGSGYEAKFIDNSNIAYRMDEYIDNMRYSTIKTKNISTGKEIVYETRQRDVTVPVISGSKLLYTKSTAMQSKTMSAIALNKTKAIEKAVAMVESNKLESIVIVENGKRTEIAPKGKVTYIWPSVSPDGNKVLFTATGDGTYISDKQGKILVKLGKLDSPKWSPDGKYIIGMEDKDDGHRYISSEIKIYSIEGKEILNVTGGKCGIAMYPSWDNSGKKAVFNNLEGNVYVAELEAK